MKVRRLLFPLVCVMVLWCSSLTVQAAGHGQDRPVKKGILLVAFGSSEPSAQISFEKIGQAVQNQYPDIPVQWAYTSHIIRQKLARQGKHLDSPEVALARMMDEKFTHVAVQSLHTIPGSEFHDLRRTIEGFRLMGGFTQIVLGDPLMATQSDLEKIVAAIFSSIPEQRKKADAVVLMGHGTHHPANAFYAALMFQLQLQDPLVYVGVVEGYPEVWLIRDLLRKQRVKTAYLMPLMSVAGDHAKNDMAGDDPDSWTSVLSASGINCIPILKGTAEFDAFVAIWVDHLAASLRQLE